MEREKRKALCSQILADDFPYLPLWFTDVVSVHRRAMGDPPLSPTPITISWLRFLLQQRSP